MQTFWTIVSVVAVSLAIYGMLSVLMSNMTKGKKMVWFIFVAIVPIIGPGVYFFTRSRGKSS